MKNAHLIHTCAINIVQRHVTGYIYGYVTRAYIQTTILGSESDGILCHAGTRKRWKLWQQMHQLAQNDARLSKEH